MPTISQLPAAAQANAADEVPLSQGGSARSVSVGSLLAGTQPAIITDQGTLLGRTSMGPGGPEPVSVGTGLAINATTLCANGADHAAFAPQPTLETTDQVVLNSAGAPKLLDLGLLRGLFSAGQNITIDPTGIIAATGTGATEPSFLVGAADPAPGIGKNGDSYLNATTGKVFAKEAAAWTDTGTNLRGPQGPAGQAGQPGATGPQGAAGSSTSITQAPAVTTMAATDLVGISHAGADHSITLANLLNAETIDQGAAAAPASDTDAFWVGQGSSTLRVQTLSALWTWIAAKLPGYQAPVTEVTANLTLDATLAGHLLICSQPVSVTAGIGVTTGFTCRVLNVSVGNVTLGGMTTSSGSSILQANQLAEVSAGAYSGGTIVFAAISGGMVLPVPGQVTALTIGTVTSSSVPLSWTAPGAGGPASGYTVNYRVTGTSAWAAAATAVPGLTFAVVGLSASTGYDFEVIATNATGSGPASSVVSTTTAAPATLPPGQPMGLSAGTLTSSSVALSWTAPSGGGAAAGYTVQYCAHGTGNWITAQTGVATASYTVTSLSASTQYDFQVIATNAAGAGPASPVISATTPMAPPGQVTGLTAGTASAVSVPLAWTAPGAGGAPSGYTVKVRVTGQTAWTTATSNATGTSYTVAGLTSSTSYDFEVIASNTGGSGPASAVVTATTALAAPGAITTLTAGAATTSTVPLSWTAPAGGGAVAGYTVQCRLHGAASWTTASSAVTATTFTVTGLTPGATYDFQVYATNAAGTGTAATLSSVATAAASNYVLTPGWLPATGSTWTSTASGIGVNANDNSASTDGGHAVPVSVAFVWSASNTISPTSSQQPGAQFSNNGHNYWGAYVNGPGTPGNYFLWAIAKDVGANVVAACVFPSAFTFT
jgi:hypothetical protein